VSKCLCSFIYKERSNHVAIVIDWTCVHVAVVGLDSDKCPN
jgi:hypothetical protein